MSVGSSRCIDAIPRHAGPDKVIGWIELTARCNLRCPYCYTDSNLSTNMQLSLEEVKQLLRDFRDIRAAKIMFSGGEPCLHPDLERILTFGGQQGLSMVLVTNGTALTKPLASLLRELGVEVQISIDAVEPERYRKSRGAPTLPLVLSNLAMLQDLGVQPTLSVTLTALVEDHLANVTEFALQRGIEFVHFGTMVPAGRGKKHRALRVRDMYRVLAQLYALQKANYLRLCIDIIENLVYSLVLDQQRDAFCNAMLGRVLEVSPAGVVYFCGSLREVPSLTLGEIRHTGLRALYERARANLMFPDLSVDHLHICGDCAYRYLCCGGCRAEAYHCADGDILAPSPFCVDMKRIIREILEDHETGVLDDYLELLRLRSSATGEDAFMKYL